MRVLRIAIVLAALVLVPFAIWGRDFFILFDGAAARQWIRGFGPWGWLAVIGLLASDLFLPVPATGVMAAAGYVFGAWTGGLLSIAGSFLSGLIGYALCRGFGRPLAARLASSEAIAENEALFRRRGPWLVVLSRWLPVLPEVIACLAGLGKMHPGIFIAALLCGTVPMGFTYALVGTMFDTEPVWALLASVILPAGLWLAFRPLLRARQDPESPPS